MPNSSILQATHCLSHGGWQADWRADFSSRGRTMSGRVWGLPLVVGGVCYVVVWTTKFPPLIHLFFLLSLPRCACCVSLFGWLDGAFPWTLSVSFCSWVWLRYACSWCACGVCCCSRSKSTTSGTSCRRLAGKPSCISAYLPPRHVTLAVAVWGGALSLVLYSGSPLVPS